MQWLKDYQQAYSKNNIRIDVIINKRLWYKVRFLHELGGIL